MATLQTPQTTRPTIQTETTATATTATTVTVPVKNFFRNVIVPDTFRRLAYKETLTLQSTDSIYYSVRCFARTPEPENPLETELDEPFGPTKDERPYALVNLNEGGMTATKRKAILDELAFLRRLRLVHKKDENTYYVSSLAYFLYKEVDGLFSIDEKERTRDSLKPLVTLLVTYTLPGYYWQAYYAKPYLPQEISMTGKLRSALTEIRALWAELRGFFTPPLQVNAQLVP